jgi:prevent-host-death family protein
VYISDTIGIREFRQNLKAVLNRVKEGETLVITDHNRPVAELRPIDVESMAPGIERLRVMGKVRPAQRPFVFDLNELYDPPPGSRPASEVLDEQREDRV